MKKYFLPLFSLVSLLLGGQVAHADIPGSKDPFGIKRYEGSEIIRFEQLKFDQYHLPLGKMVKFDFGTKDAQFEKEEIIEGDITRVSYRVPDPNRSSLEVVRNYEESLSAAGWEVLWKGSGKAQLGNSFTHIFESLKDNDQLFTYNDSQHHLLCVRKASEGLSAMLFVTKYQYGLRRGITINPGDPIIHLDVIQSKKMDQKMVLVEASAMEKAIAETGKVALYGIEFDFNKADIRSESRVVIAEIAKLLNAKPDLKVVVAGHTDSVGNFEFNRDLSQRRATSVTDMLTKEYGIVPGRLTPFGVAFAAPVASNDTEDGRSKNRRVEIVGLK